MIPERFHEVLDRYQGDPEEIRTEAQRLLSEHEGGASLPEEYAHALREQLGHQANDGDIEGA